MTIRITSSLFVFAILSACPAIAQTSSFEKVVPAPLLSFDAFARAAQVAPDQGRCVFATNALIGQLGDADVLMLRVNGAGDIVQSLTIGDTTGQGYHDVAKEVVQSDKHYYVSGYTRAIDTSAAHTFTAFLIKVDTALNFKWQKNYILPGQEMYAEVMTPIGGSDLLVAGKIYDGNDFQSFLMRTDSTGAVQWIKQYQMPFGETIQCVRPLPGGDLLMSGSMIFGFELVLPFVCKVTAQGDWIWGKYYNYPPMSIVENSSFLFVRAASVNDILLAGHTDVFGAGSLDAYVVNIDSSGAINWARTYGGSQFDLPYAVQFDVAENELVMAGNSGSFTSSGTPHAMAMRIDAGGALLATALYGDTATLQQAALYHGSRIAQDQRLLMGARFFPADDLYITGTDDLLTNACNHHPVSASMIAQTTSFGGFAATVTVPEPTVTNDELGHGVYIDGTMLCLPPTAVNAPAGAADQPLLYPSPGDGDFRVDLPAGSNAVAIQLLDMEGRVVWRAGSVNAEVRIPGTIVNGHYVVSIEDANGERTVLRYALQR
ncbi:MAG: T9SS type A sorting domain-containing protein [Flavobacteriales bacterium]|nr:T9SS type A sorting domain-containing protein [Flavobacteriales bacterium]